MSFSISAQFVQYPHSLSALIIRTPTEFNNSSKCNNMQITQNWYRPLNFNWFLIYFLITESEDRWSDQKFIESSIIDHSKYCSVCKQQWCWMTNIDFRLKSEIEMQSAFVEIPVDKIEAVILGNIKCYRCRRRSKQQNNWYQMIGWKYHVSLNNN